MRKSISVVALFSVIIFSVALNSFAYYLSQSINTYSKNLIVVVQLKPEVPQGAEQELKNQITEMYGVTSSRFISKEDTIAELSKKLGTKFNFLENPFSDQIIVVIKPGISVSELAATIESSDYVRECDFDQNYLSEVSNVISIEKKIWKISAYGGNFLLLMLSVMCSFSLYDLFSDSARSRREVMLRVVGIWILNIIMGYIIAMILYSVITHNFNIVSRGDTISFKALLQSTSMFPIVFMIISAIILSLSRSEK